VATGVFMLCSGFVGHAGALKKHVWLIGIYAILTGIFFLLFLALAIVGGVA